jgi:hypothetical protein
LTYRIGCATIPTMTNDEKFTAIVERLKAKEWMVEENMISVMVIISYLDKLEKMKLVECAFNMTPAGNNIAAICEEFDWRPTDAQIQQFVTEMVEDDGESRVAMAYMVRMYRDNREKLIDEVERFRNGN